MEQFNFDFGQLQQIDKKYTKEGGGPTGRRGPDYKGLRYSVSSKGKGKIEASDTMWDEMGLATNGLRATITPNGSLLILVFPQDSKFTVLYGTPKTDKKTGESFKKSQAVNSSEFVSAMIKTGVVDEVTSEQAGENKPVHQYVKFTKLDKSQISNLPSEAIAVYVAEKDEVSNTEESSSNDEDSTPSESKEDKVEDKVEDTVNAPTPSVTADLSDEDDF